MTFLGYAPDHPHRAIARKSIDRLLIIGEEEAYCQPCVSPIWDTALAGGLRSWRPAAQKRATGHHSLCEWLKARQVLDVKGDWADARPEVRPAARHFNITMRIIPISMTPLSSMALDRAQAAGNEDCTQAIARGREWVEGLQSENGGWAAFDADNTYYYLNNIPFADHGALLDPPTADVTARCVGMLAQLGEPLSSPRVKTAVDYLASIQEPDGAGSAAGASTTSTGRGRRSQASTRPVLIRMRR